MYFVETRGGFYTQLDFMVYKYFKVYTATVSIPCVWCESGVKLQLKSLCNLKKKKRRQTSCQVTKDFLVRFIDPLIMMSFTEKHCGSSLSSWLIVDTLLISKLFTPFVPICSQFRLYICYLGELVKNKTHRFQCFSATDVIIERVYAIYRYIMLPVTIHLWIARAFSNKIQVESILVTKKVYCFI